MSKPTTIKTGLSPEQWKMLYAMEHDIEKMPNDLILAELEKLLRIITSRSDRTLH